MSKTFSFVPLAGLGISKYSKIMQEDEFLSGLLIYHNFRFLGRQRYLQKIESFFQAEEGFGGEYGR